MSLATSPAIWAIGDIQGCCRPLDSLLSHPDVAADNQAKFWFAGDLVNRGPDSLGALRLIRSLGDRAVCVLGNHDIHCLAVAAGVRKSSKQDTLQELLAAPDAQELLDWLRHQPLAHYEHGHLMVHAGVHPDWSPQQTLEYAHELEALLRADDWQDKIIELFGNKPDRWDTDLQGYDRLRAIVSTLTRMRMCDLNGRMDFKHKGAPDTESGLLAWYELPNRACAQVPVIFGHWSTLGLLNTPTVISLDTGCVWGRQLSAVRLQDRHLVQIHCPESKKPG
ncbi:symmetrical bis(5'-nucleosyl)-tetraphosphatase [Alcaligenes faecalis]|uniref:symmetrical bis(5'-nucleosyl)-tetraphosphatase n=1 Tax=Alcaligenes faecalis TaxID=511 RepID=UPI0029328AC8|nr:symmetrical bis(5'-nucleosyl)-tetraphosphatase [Alcaligenes faecalis]MDV2117278.1 symmetrical bis(5'-nucleosyl)-tetraphosphatase [Alcaligenes faecalis]